MYTSSTFADMQQKSIIWREHDDCCVKAMAIALDISYAHAWRICRQHGRPFREGMWFESFLEAFIPEGYSTDRLTYKGSLHNFMRIYNKGTYIIDSITPKDKHVHIYKDGIMHDAVANWIGQIVDVYELVKND